MHNGCAEGTDHDPSRLTPAAMADYRRILWIVLAINATMFLVEITSGLLGRSVSLQADALDFLGDSFAYAITLFIVSTHIRWRARVALLKGLSMLCFGLWVIGTTIYHALYSAVPLAAVMGTVGTVALIANVVSALLLYRHRSGDANTRSVWLCTRNDAISNVAVIAAAGAVEFTGSGWPDYAVAFIMATLAMSSSVKVLRLSLAELAGSQRPMPSDAS
jgi:Co/Zn/Cd efflux system component